MTHHHHHDHHHHEKESDLTFNEKIIKLLDHWIKHNQDHAATYSDWAKRAAENGLHETESLLLKAAAMNLDINSMFEEAIKTVPGPGE